MSEKRYKILYVADSFGGGIFTYLKNLSNRLIDDFDIVIAYGTNYETPKEFRTYFDNRIRLIRVNGFGAEPDKINESASKSELQELAEAENPDLIHLHGYTAGQIGRKAFDKYDVPVFYTPHGYKFLAEDHNKLMRSIFRMNEASAAKTGSFTIACSRGEFAESLGLTDKAFYIKNGLDLASIDEMLQGAPSDPKKTVFTIGAINKQKNPALFNQIAMAMPDVEFIWIGDGELRYLLTAPNIKVTGWLERKEALQKAMYSDIFILTSLWEGMPYTLLEAMYMKKLCIVSNVIGNRDVVNNGVNGFISDSAASFVNAINHASDPESKACIDAAYEDIVKNYSVDKMAKAYSDVYLSILDKD